MRKNVLIVFALMMLSACGGRQTQAESAGAAVADSTEVLAPKETESMADHHQSCRLTGTIGEDKASMVLDKNGNNVTGVVTRCDYCVPIHVEGTWQGDNITVAGVSQAGSHIEYKLTVTANAVQGAEIMCSLFSNKRRQKYCFYVLDKVCIAGKYYLFSSLLLSKCVIFFS